VKLAIHYIKKNSVVNGASTPSRGSIICTASNAGIYPFGVAPLYAASKSGVIGLVRGLALQLEREAIQINALAPAVLGKWYGNAAGRAKLIAFSRNKYCAQQRLVQAHDRHANVDSHERSATAGVGPSTDRAGGGDSWRECDFESSTAIRG
jgi:NAD(P)-dependent dehydrogenase (short-subunit alcohol dehydrogenase family)